jgi:hypothetical protein
VTTAPQLAVGTTTSGFDDTSFSVFQLVNGPAGTIIVCGNIFLGLQGYCCVRVPMGELKGLDRGATIETGLTSAAVSFTAAGSWTAGGTILCNVMVDDSPRGSAEDGLGEASPFDNRNAWKSPNGYGPAWRRDFSGVFDMRLEDTVATPFVDTGVATGGSFGFRTVADLRESMAHPFTVPAGPSWSVARALMRMRRFGVPAGSLEVAIQGQATDAFGHIQPDGVDLGVSAAVLNTTLPLNPAIGQVTYAFAPDVVLPPGNYWAVMRFSGAPPAYSLVDFVVWGQRRVFLGPGGAHRTLVGRRFDHGNYPGHADISLDLAAKEVGTDIVWNPIARVSGQAVSTPDLSPLVEEVIRNSGHETIDALCFTFRTVGETRTYRFAAHDHATLNPPGFACQYRRRNIRGEVG